MNAMQEEPLYELNTERNLLEIQGVTCDRNYLHVVGIYALLCIAPCSLLYLWPQAGLITSLCIFFSIIQDIRGKQGWIRGLLLKHCGKNIISWYHQRIPTQAYERPPVVPSVVVALPYTIHKIKKWPFVTILGMWVFVMSMPFLAGMLGTHIHAWISGLLLCITLVCFAFPHPKQQINTHNIEKHNKIRSVWNNRVRRRKLVVLLYEDGINGGGLSTFLQNYRDFVPPTHSFLLLLEEAQQRQVSFPSFLLGTKKPPESVASLFPQPISSIPSSAHATYTYGWSSVIVHTPFTEGDIEEIFSFVDTVE